MPLGDMAHRRFARWIRLCGETTRELARCVEDILLPAFLDAGFVPVDIEAGNKARPVGGREIRLERFDGAAFDVVTIAFDKYREARFQISVRKETGVEDACADWANLVPRQRDYFHFWGKPWWLPGLWGAEASAKVATRLAGLLPQCEAFFAAGVRGPNLSRAVARVVIPPATASAEG